MIASWSLLALASQNLRMSARFCFCTVSCCCTFASFASERPLEIVGALPAVGSDVLGPVRFYRK